MNGFSLKNFILRLMQGAIIGAGAILPGVSGGVLAVIFGIYRPMMETITSPKTGLRKYWWMFVPVLLGWAVGFLGGGGVILLLFASSETLATCLFVGLILGTIPALWKEAGEQGRSKASCGAMAISFLLLFSVLLAVRFGAFSPMRENFFGFLFCGVLWGLSFIVPGMTSSSILMAVGLLEPMVAGISSFDMTVLVPWGLGMLGVVAAFARVVNWLFHKHYSIAYHAVLGIVLASTFIIIPTAYASTKELLLCVLCAASGALLAHFCGKLQPKEEAK